ncbi:transposase [Mesorhizobium sp. M0166]|uniref:transposase n=1 Tax=Mesorhizobium sp. M0166 TaxID=2956902 RepID=UPI0033351178
MVAPSLRRRRQCGEKTDAGSRRPGHVDHRIVKRSDTAKGFEVLPRRWVIERTFAWLGCCRRLAKDFEATIASAEAWVFIASIRLMLRRRATPPHTVSSQVLRTDKLWKRPYLYRELRGVLLRYGA